MVFRFVRRMPLRWGCALVLFGAASPLRGGESTVSRDSLETAELGRAYEDAYFRSAAADADAEIRRLAARAAGRLKEPRAIDWLLPLLRDAAPAVRRASLFALGQIGADTAVVALRSAVPLLNLQDLPFALDALGKCGDARAAAPLVAHLRHGDPHVRAAAALGLFRLRDTSVLPELFASLAPAAEVDGDSRWSKTYACWRLLRERARASGAPVEAPEEWRKVLHEAVGRDRPFELRVFATLALGEIADTREVLLPLLRDADVRVVVAAARALAQPFDAAVAAEVMLLLDSEDLLLRETALEHLAAGGQEAAPVLLSSIARVARSPRLCIQAGAAAAAAGARPTLPEEAAGWSVGDREEWSWRVFASDPARIPGVSPTTTQGKRAAAEACAQEKFPADRAVAELLPLLKDPDFTVRATALGSLGKRGTPEHVPAIVASALDAVGRANMDIRIEAAGALKSLKQFDPWLREAAAQDPDGSVRLAAREALAELGKSLPPAPPLGGFRLGGLDAPGILREARALRGARVRMETDRGVLEMALFPDEAPAHCVNLAHLVQRGFYDGLLWHRVVADFVIQGGCPRGDGWGGPGYTLPDEISPIPYVRGTVGMPKSGDDTGGCQIFITHLPTPHLDGRYTVFAQVVTGLETIDRIRVGDHIRKATLVPAPEGASGD